VPDGGVIEANPMGATEAARGGSPLAGNMQEGDVGRLILGPDALEPGPVLPVVREVETPEAGIFSGFLERGTVSLATRPCCPGRLQFPDFAPIIAAL